MFWRFGEPPTGGGDPPLLYDELCHCIRKGDGPWVRLPHEPALILKLLLRMHARGRAVTPGEICAFLKLPQGTRIRCHVTELREKIAECGGDPKLIEVMTADTGYRLAASAAVVAMAQVDELRLIDRMLAHPEVAPEVRLQLKPLYAMLALSAVVAIGVASWALLSHDEESPPIADRDPKEEEPPIADRDREEGQPPRTLLPAPGVRAFVSPSEGGSVRATADGYEATLERDPNTEAPAEACFELPEKLALRDDGYLVADLELLAPAAATRLAISVEQVPPARVASVAFDVAPGPVSTVRVPAERISPELRAHGRRICVGEDRDQPTSLSGVITLKVRAVRVQ